MSGTLALVGGSEFTDGCDFDRNLLTASGGDEVVVVPTAAAFENPQSHRRSGHAPGSESLGATIRVVSVLTRGDGLLEENLAAVRGARFVYLPGGSPMHLRAVLKDSPFYERAARDARRRRCAGRVGSRRGRVVRSDGGHPRWSVHRGTRLGPRSGRDPTREHLVTRQGAAHRRARARRAWPSWAFPRRPRSCATARGGGAKGVGDCIVYRDGAVADLSVLPI